MARAVFFDTVSAFHWPLLAWHRGQGDAIAVFDFHLDAALQRQAWVRALLRQGAIRRIYVPSSSVASDQALDMAETIFAGFRGHPVTRALARIFRPDEVETVLKRALAEGLFRYLFMRRMIESQVAAAPGREAPHTVIVSGEFWWWHRLLRRCAGESALPVAVHCPRWLRLLTGLPALWQGMRLRLASCALVVGHLAASLIGRWLRRPTGPVQSARYAYAVDQPFQVRVHGLRRFDFLLDGRHLTQQNTLFLVRASADGPWVDEAIRAGYRCVRLASFPDAGHPHRQFHCAGRGAALGRTAAALCRIVWSADTPDWLYAAAMRGLLAHLCASTMLDQLGMSHYVYMNQDHVSQYWLNAVLRSRGVQSWDFSFSIGGGYLYHPASEFGQRQWVWSFQNSDHFVASSRRMVDYRRRHTAAIRSYHVVGNVWSELIQLGDKRLDRAVRHEEWFGPARGPRRVMAWFDTTFIEADNSPSTQSEALAWYRDLSRLLEEDPRLCALIKPSKGAQFFLNEQSKWSHALGRDLVQVWDRLRRHPRVHFAGHEADAAEVAALSDLTVTFCFSSPSAEALGAGRRAIWYEPGERWRDALYASAPGLVAHGYEELRALVNRRLDESDEAYRAYVNEHVRGLVEEHCDGQGLTRFRDLLAGASSAADRACGEPALVGARNA